MRMFELWILTGLALFAGHMLRTANLVRSTRSRMMVIGRQGKIVEIGYPDEKPIYVKPVAHRSSA